MSDTSNRAKATKAPLSGLKLVVTRPAHLALNLCQLLEAAGASVLKAPTIEIIDLSDAPHPELTGLARFCAIVFISRNAALYGCKLFTKLELDLSTHKVFAVGIKTAKELQSLGVQNVIYPTEGAGSKALLAHPELMALAAPGAQGSGEVLVVRGVGGSETLKEGLAAFGVRTIYAEVYRRQMPSTPLRLDAAPDAVIAASTESLYNLYHSIDPTQRQTLLKAQAFVASEQAQKLAAKLGFEQSAIRASSATDEDMLARLCAWAQETKQDLGQNSGHNSGRSGS